MYSVLSKLSEYIYTFVYVFKILEMFLKPSVYP